MSKTVRACIVAAGEGAELQGPVGGPLELMLHGDDTGGRFTALVNDVAPGEGPPLHTHDEQDEAWFVARGHLRFRIEDDLHDAPAGSWAFVPKGMRHCFQNVGEEMARIHVMFTPAGMEPFFEAFSSVESEGAGPETFARLGEPCGMRIVGPPLAMSHPR